MYKSRTLASSAIKGGKVKFKDALVKPSHTVAIDEVFTISVGNGIKKIIQVTDILDKRQSFEIAQKYYKDLSPPVEKQEKMEAAFFKTNVIHERGTGRPTKKDRRDLGKLGGWF